MLVGSILPSCKIHDPNCSTRQHQSAIKIATFSEIKSACSHAEKTWGTVYGILKTGNSDCKKNEHRNLGTHHLDSTVCLAVEDPAS